MEGMEQSLEGYAYSVKEVLKRSKSGVLTGILGTVSQLIQVEEEYAAAIETALGGAMQNLVTEDESAAKSAIRLLKQDNLGRATFLPLTSVQGGLLQVQGLEQYGGYVDLACNLIAYDPRYRQVMESLLGRIAIVDDLDTATIIARKYGYKFRIVTLDGQVVNAGGSMTGGSRNKSQNFLSRKNEIHALHGEIQSLREKSAGLTAQLRELQEDGIIARNVIPSVPPQVEYSLTSHGETLNPVLDAMCQWGTNYMDGLDVQSPCCNAGA